MQQTNLSKHGKKCLSLIEFDEEEKVIAEIRRHPFGLFLIYTTGLTIAVIVFAALVGGGLLAEGDRADFGFDIGVLKTILVVAGTVLAGLVLVGTAIAGYLYKNNVVILTSEKIAQFLYTSLFDRKISQLSIGDVQDVTVSQKGVFSRIFNYGTLVIETAGEQQNYMFTYTPDPYNTSKKIVGAHEENLKKYGN